MAGVKIENLPAATTPLAGTELVPIVQSGVTVKVAASNFSGSSNYTAPGTGAVTRSISSKLGDLITPQDFGAVGDGVTDDTTAWSNWDNASGSKYIPAGEYLTYGSVKRYVNGTFTDNYSNYSAGLDAFSSVNNSAYVTAIGSACGQDSNGDYNTFVGANCAQSVTGYQNTAIGFEALYSCAGGNYNTALGENALSALVAYDNCTGIGSAANVTGSDQVQLGDSATTTYAYGAVQNRSDARDKADIRDTQLGLAFVKSLRPVDFKWDYREDYNWGEKDGSKKRSRFHHGLIAQEVAVACSFLDVDFGGLQDHSIAGGKDVMSIGYEELIAPMIKAIQELTAKVESLELQVKNLNLK
jgi:hypothetical protein